MRSLMPFQGVVRVEALLTDLAGKRAWVLVDVLNVLQLTRLGFEGCPTNVTKKLPIIGVHGHMLSKMALRKEKEKILQHLIEVKKLTVIDSYLKFKKKSEEFYLPI